MAQPGYAAYQTALLTVPPLKAIVMLYDGAIVRTKAAADAARRGDYLTQFNEVRKATEILNGLNRCLDMEAGGKVAVSLREMYNSVVKALMRSVGSEVGAQCCDKIAGAIRLTRDAWAEIAESGTAVPNHEIPSAASLNINEHG